MSDKKISAFLATDPEIIKHCPPWVKSLYEQLKKEEI
jgi:hypothetical protein